MKAIDKSRKWLAKETGYSENTVRIYLGKKENVGARFLSKAEEAIHKAETSRNANKPEGQPWPMVLFNQEEFDRVDRASRLMDSQSIAEFCLKVIMDRTDAIIGRQSATNYRKIRKITAAKAAEEPDG